MPKSGGACYFADDRLTIIGDATGIRELADRYRTPTRRSTRPGA